MPSRIANSAIGIVVTAASLASAACGNPAPMPAPASLADALDTLRRGGRIDRAHVEQAFGARLATTGETDGPFARFAARDVRVDGATVTIDLREPVAGRGATAGALLNLRIGGDCLARAAVEERYGPLAVSDLPRGRSLDETMGMSREEPWGRLTFGFAERAPDCLATVTFAAKD